MSERTPEFKTIEGCAVELISFTDSVDANFCMDRMPARAARVSFNNDSVALDNSLEAEEKDRKLMRYLGDHQHTTPFEYQHATFLIECPLFVRSQIHRHRTFSFNEVSRRYTSDDVDFWIPTQLRKQSESNKQGSDGIFALDEYQGYIEGYKTRCLNALSVYESMVHIGVAREQARAELPQSILTRFYMGGNLRNWTHFLELRLDSHAQYETRVVAKKIALDLLNLWPDSMRTLLHERS